MNGTWVTTMVKIRAGSSGARRTHRARVLSVFCVVLGPGAGAWRASATAVIATPQSRYRKRSSVSIKRYSAECFGTEARGAAGRDGEPPGRTAAELPNTAVIGYFWYFAATASASFWPSSRAASTVVF